MLVSNLAPLGPRDQGWRPGMTSEERGVSKNLNARSANSGLQVRWLVLELATARGR